MSNYKINPLINEKNKSLFSGVGVASVTPFDHNGNVDLDAIDKLCEYFFLGGISYVVVQGTTGESSTLNPQEKAIVNQRFVTALKNKLPLILGISSNSTTELCDLISKTDTTGFEAIMSVCPYYNKPSQEGIYQHFKKAVDISPLPILLYNVPGRTSSDISDDTIIKLSSYSKKIIGIKEASGITNRIANLRKNTHDEFLVISGDDFTMIDAVRAGADGIISVAANAYPSIMNSTYIQLLYENDKSKPQNISKIKLNSSEFVLNNFFQLIFDEEKIKYDENSLIKLSSLARGSMRDALTLSEKVISFSEGKITEKKVEELMGLPSSELIQSILKSIIGRDSKKLIENIEEVKINFYDPEQILIDLLSLIQEVALSQFDEKADLSDLSIEPQNLQLIYDLGISNLEYFKLSPKPESLLTMTFLKMIAFLPESSKKKSLNTNKDETDFSWPEDFSNLDLTKLTAQFMSHASMIEYHDSEMHFGINQERLNIITENQIKEVEDALSILLKKKLKVSFKPSDLTETPFEFEKIRSQKESKQAEDDLKKDSSLNEMLEKFDGKIKKVSKI